MVTILTSGATRITALDRSPDFTQIKDEIGGGFLEPVPFFDTVMIKGEVRRCVAFCDEDGKLKNLDFNPGATLLWKSAQVRSRRGVNDVLVGPVAIVFGDDELLEAL